MVKRQRIKDDVYVYAEGGGDSDALKSELRQGMAAFFGQCPSLIGRRPRVVACGGREQAFDQFKTALALGKNALLLVDSETLPDPHHQPPPDGNWHPWAHLRTQAGWQAPANAKEIDCHLMVPCMEGWFMADWSVLVSYFGTGFRADLKPSQKPDELTKEKVYQVLAQATKGSRKGSYGKGAHSFELLGRLDVTKVLSASPWAKRLVDELVGRKI